MPATSVPLDVALPAEAEEALQVAPARLREQLAADLASGYPAMIRVLREAMDADGDHWVTCRSCNNKTVYLGPDHKTRLQAVEKWVAMGLGQKKDDSGSGNRLTEFPPELDMDQWTDEELKAFILEGYTADPASLRHELDDARVFHERFRGAGDEPNARALPA